MSCDINWLKLQEVIKASRKTNNSDKSSKHASADVLKSRKRTKLDGEAKNEKKEKYPTKSSLLFKKLGMDAKTIPESERDRKYWEEEGVVFDVIPTPQVRKRDKDFEKFLLDDVGDVIDGTEEEPSVLNLSEGLGNAQKDQKANRVKNLNLPKLLQNTAAKKIPTGQRARLELPTGHKELTKVVAIDCEMVGALESGHLSLVARVSIVNSHGHPLYDNYVTPSVTVTDYRTQFSGITPEILEKKGEPFQKVQSEVAALLKGRILVGHALHHDLRVLYLNHPKQDIRDTSLFPPFRRHFGKQKRRGGTPALRKLAAEVLGIQIQTGEHDSIQDAQAAMKLYMLHRSRWEYWFANKMKRAEEEAVKKSEAQRIKESADEEEGACEDYGEEVPQNEKEKKKLRPSKKKRKRGKKK